MNTLLLFVLASGAGDLVYISWLYSGKCFEYGHCGLVTFKIKLSMCKDRSRILEFLMCIIWLMGQKPNSDWDAM
jgi:hypothetical protein